MIKNILRCTFVRKATVMLGNHNGRKHKMFNPDTECVPLYLFQYTHSLSVHIRTLAIWSWTLYTNYQSSWACVWGTAFHFRHWVQWVPSNINHSIFAVSLVRDGICYPDSEDKPHMTGNKIWVWKKSSLAEKFLNC